jgi:hypothetical protein
MAMDNASVEISPAATTLSFTSPTGNDSTPETPLNYYETSNNVGFTTMKVTISAAGIVTNLFVIVIIVGFMQVTAKV